MSRREIFETLNCQISFGRNLVIRHGKKHYD